MPPLPWHSGAHTPCVLSLARRGGGRFTRPSKRLPPPHRARDSCPESCTVEGAVVDLAGVAPAHEVGAPATLSHHAAAAIYDAFRHISPSEAGHSPGRPAPR